MGEVAVVTAVAAAGFLYHERLGKKSVQATSALSIATTAKSMMVLSNKLLQQLRLGTLNI